MSQRQPRVYRRSDNRSLRLGCLAFVGLFFVICIGCSGLYGTAMFASAPDFFILATILATMTAVPYGFLLWWLDHNEPEPISLLITSFLWGACVSTMLSLVLNTTSGGIFYSLVGDAGLANFMTASLAAPLFEELTKGIAVGLLFALFQREFDNVLDGIIYGAFIGLGFAWFENILYYMNAAEAGGLPGMLQNAWARGGGQRHRGQPRGVYRVDRLRLWSGPDHPAWRPAVADGAVVLGVIDVRPLRLEHLRRSRRLHHQPGQRSRSVPGRFAHRGRHSAAAVHPVAARDGGPLLAA